jgi:hypothetical protein
MSNITISEDHPLPGRGWALFQRCTSEYSGTSDDCLHELKTLRGEPGSAFMGWMKEYGKVLREDDRHGSEKMSLMRTRLFRLGRQISDLLC